MKSINNTRKTASISPLRNLSITPISRSRASVPRSSKMMQKDSEKKMNASIYNKVDSTRFITGDRLKPMHKKEAILKPKTTRRKKYDVSILIKELNGESSKDIQEFKEEENNLINNKDKAQGTTQEKIFESVESADDQIEMKETFGSKDKNYSDCISIASNQETEKGGIRISEKSSIATQVDRFDRSLLKSMRNKAAVIIQKHCRGFIAKKNFEYKKYSKELHEAELQAKLAQEKLNSLKKKRENKIILPEPVRIYPELIPVAYKDKLHSPTRTSERNRLPNIKKKASLSIIPEEKEAYYYKLISIQSYFRGWGTRKEYTLKRNAIATIQKNIKRFLTRKLFLRIKHAVMYIQQFWRHRIQKKAYEINEKA